MAFVSAAQARYRDSLSFVDYFERRNLILYSRSLARSQSPGNSGSPLKRLAGVDNLLVFTDDYRITGDSIQR
jgi:hypothetical protein